MSRTIIPPQWLHSMCFRGPEVWLPIAGQVEGAGGGLQDIEPNILQRRLLTAWKARYDAGRPARIVGLKPRKKGFSTISAACHYWMMRRHPTNIGLLGHQDNASTATLFQMMKVFRDNDRNAGNWGNQSTTSSEEEMRFSHGSSLLRLTANNPAKVRSSTLQAVSATEWAFWRESVKALQAALNAMPQDVFTSFIGESTPEGLTGSFPTTWKNGRWPSAAECPGGELYWKQWESFLPDQADTSIPESELFIRIFAAWYEFDDAFVRLTPAEERAQRESIDGEDWYYGEQDLIDRYLHVRPDGVSVLGKEVQHANVWEQLAWRRTRIMTACNGDRRSFDEEYPADPHTCFLSSGSPYFDPESITTLDQITLHVPKAETGVLDWKPRSEAGPPNEVTWHATRTDAHLFHIWEHPKEGCAYLVTVDSATGENNVVDGDPDRHSILVIRKPYRDTDGTIYRAKVVARVRPPCLVPLYSAAEWSARLATYYQALVVPEINNTGQAIVIALRNWPHVRIAKRTAGEDPRTGRRQKKELVGHLTDEATRIAVLDYLHKVLRAEMIDVHCPHLIYELRIFNNDPNKGRPEAPEGEHDDDVMALAIGLHWLDHATAYTIASRKRGDVSRDYPSARGARPSGSSAMTS